MLSARNWLKRRWREAPREARTATSFLARGGASHQEVRDVGAGDQQDETDRAEQQPESGTHVAIEKIVLQRLDARAPAFIRFGIDFGDVGA